LLSGLFLIQIWITRFAPLFMTWKSLGIRSHIYVNNSKTITVREDIPHIPRFSTIFPVKTLG
jgi:hypothetical protein